MLYEAAWDAGPASASLQAALRFVFWEEEKKETKDLHLRVV
jgi:hypothetical protein